MSRTQIVTWALLLAAIAVDLKTMQDTAAERAEATTHRIELAKARGETEIMVRLCGGLGQAL
jgi:hypothetical protein